MTYHPLTEFSYMGWREVGNLNSFLSIRHTESRLRFRGFIFRIVEDTTSHPTEQCFRYCYKGGSKLGNTY